MRKLTLLLLSMLTIMAAGIIAPALPSLAEEFARQANATLLSKLVLSLPAVFIAFSAPLAGRFIDKHGRLKLLYLAIILYIFSGCSAYFLDNIYFILAGRAFLGISIGIIMTITNTLIGDYFEGEIRKKFIGYQAAFIGLAGVVFLTLGGILADISWRMPFLVYALPILILPLCVMYLQEPDKSDEGAVLRKAISNKLLYIIFVNAVIFMILFYILPTQLPFYLMDIGFTQKTLSGTALAVNAAGMIISSLFYSTIKDRLPFTYLYTLALLLMAVGFWIVILTIKLPFILLGMFITGLGIGLYLANTNLWVIELAETELRGRYLGILTTCLFLGQFLSPIVTEPFVRHFDLYWLFFWSGNFMVILGGLFLVFGKYLMNLESALKR